MAEIKRLDILDAIKVNLQTIRAGQDVDGMVEDTYTKSVGFVGLGPVDVTSFADREFPAVLLIDDMGSSFEPNGDMYATYNATWPVGVVIVVKDKGKPSNRGNTIARDVETVFRDVDMAMHRDGQIYPSADVSISLRSLDVDTLADGTFATATAIYEISYVHRSF